MMGALVRVCGVLVVAPAFQTAVLAAIVINAVIVGLETRPTLVRDHGVVFAIVDRVVLCCFVAELSIRGLAVWPHPGRFFRNGWNVFDTIVIGASLLPQMGTFAAVARLARLLRVTRVVSTVPELRLIVGTMLRSIPSLGHVTLLLGLLLYVYGVLGYHLFHVRDPAHWGSLPTAFITLFQILTLEGWVEIERATAGTRPWSWLFFATFIVIAVFVVVNLFIAVVLNNLEAAKAEEQARGDQRRPEEALLVELAAIRNRILAIEGALRSRNGTAVEVLDPHGVSGV